MTYDFLIDTYEIERLKTLNVWSMFKDKEMLLRPKPLNERDRNPREHMIHQCLSENKWFVNMFGIDVNLPPLPTEETQLEMIKHYAEVSARRRDALTEKDNVWWEQEIAFFDNQKSRAWVLVRRVAHTAHHRGEQTTLIRILEREPHSVYGPSAFSGGLPDNNATTIYAYQDVASLIEGESKGGAKAALPGPGHKPSTERPDSKDQLLE